MDLPEVEGETVIAILYFVTEGTEKTFKLINNIVTHNIYEDVVIPIELRRAGNKYLYK